MEDAAFVLLDSILLRSSPDLLGVIVLTISLAMMPKLVSRHYAPSQLRPQVIAAYKGLSAAGIGKEFLVASVLAAVDSKLQAPLEGRWELERLRSELSDALEGRLPWELSGIIPAIDEEGLDRYIAKMERQIEKLTAEITKHSVLQAEWRSIRPEELERGMHSLWNSLILANKVADHETHFNKRHESYGEA